MLLSIKYFSHVQFWKLGNILGYFTVLVGEYLIMWCIWTNLEWKYLMDHNSGYLMLYSHCLHLSCKMPPSLMEWAVHAISAFQRIVCKNSLIDLINRSAWNCCLLFGIQLVSEVEKGLSLRCHTIFETSLIFTLMGLRNLNLKKRLEFW